MNARTIRRAIERKARKQARKSEADRLPIADTQDVTIQNEAAIAGEPSTTDQNNEPGEIRTTPPQRNKPKPPVSSAQLEANRQNSLLSTGPKTLSGRSTSSLNAIKTGLTGRTVLLTSDDADLYRRHVDHFFTASKPVGEEEADLVQRMADTQWRLYRIPGLEMGIYALGRIEFAEKFAAYPHHEAAALIQAQTFLAYQKQLNNLGVQESRLRRQYSTDRNELFKLQTQRRSQASRSEPIEEHLPSSQKSPKPALDNPAASRAITPAALENGFEFEKSGNDLFATLARQEFFKWKSANAA